MASPPGKSLYVDASGNFSIQTSSDVPSPSKDELIIRTLYSGINPADARHSSMLGIYDTVLGYDFCGIVTSSPLASKYHEGDVVAGYTPSGIGRLPKYGAHQSYFSCPENMVFKVPENMPQTHAAAFTVIAMTAADVVYNIFKFPLPPAAGDHRFTGPILIWGASAGVGWCALQFLKASGCTNIFVTASPQRFEKLKGLGATRCFDYSSPTVINDIAASVKELDQGPILHALDAVGRFAPPSSSDLMMECANDPKAILSSTTRLDPKFRFPSAAMNAEWSIHPKGAPGPITIPARPKEHWHAWEACAWAIENYGSKFTLPTVEVFEGKAEEALQEVHKVADARRGFGKLVLKHPLQ